jgi:hypothetical protein
VDEHKHICGADTFMKGTLESLIFSTVWVARKFCGKKEILEIVNGFSNERLWNHWVPYMPT